MPYALGFARGFDKGGKPVGRVRLGKADTCYMRDGLLERIAVKASICFGGGTSRPQTSPNNSEMGGGISSIKMPGTPEGSFPAVNSWGTNEMCQMLEANSLSSVVPTLRKDESGGLDMLNWDKEALLNKEVPEEKIALVLELIEKLKGNQELCSYAFDSLVLGEESLKEGILAMYTKVDLQGKLGISSDLLLEYISAVSKKYNDVAFHNFTHVFDVTQMLYTLVTKSGLHTKLSDAQLVGLFLAAPSHDLDHPGLSNTYQVNAGTDLAKKYNNTSVLESHHTDLCLALVDELKLLQNCSTEKAEMIKATIKTAILGTDMAKHKSYMDALSAHNKDDSIVDPQKNQFESEVGILLLVTLMKCADISNPSRPLVVADKWNDLCYEEFYNEGDLDKEAGRKVVPLFDRETNNISKSTVGFVNFVVMPLYKNLDALLKKFAVGHPELNSDALLPVIKQLEQNVEVHKKRSAVEISNGQQ